MLNHTVFSRYPFSYQRQNLATYEMKLSIALRLFNDNKNIMSAKCSGCNEIHVVFSAWCYKIYITLRSSKCRSRWVQNVRKSLAPKHWRYVFPTSLYLFVVSHNSLIITPLSFANKTLWLIKAIFMTHYFHSYTSLFIFIVTQDCFLSLVTQDRLLSLVTQDCLLSWLHKTV